MDQKIYYVYIITNKHNTVLYTGVTSRIRERVWEHGTKQSAKSFTARYQINKLIYLENYSSIHDALAREKQIKKGSRQKKIALINAVNPKWKDLLQD